MSEVSQSRPVREEQRPARPDIDEVAPNVLRIQLPISFPGLGHVNCYVMEDSRGITLVDPGLPGMRTRRHLKKQLAAAGFDIDRVHTVVVTHSHPDHFGQAGTFRRAGAEIITHRSFRTFLDPEAEADDEDLATVVDPGTDDGHDSHNDSHSHNGHGPTGCAHGGAAANGRHQPAAEGAGRAVGPLVDVTPWGGKPYDLPRGRKLKYRLMRLAAGRFLSTPAPTRRVDDADVLELGGMPWISVHTPGHTEDHLCLWNPDSGVMISGDHVLPTITPHISGLSESPDPLSQFFESLDRMKTFAGVTAVLPAHGLVFQDLHGRADAISRHHHDRLDQLRVAGETIGDGTVEQYMKALFKPRAWGPMAESETYAHLQHLHLRNQADTNSDGPQLRYRMKD